MTTYPIMIFIRIIPTFMQFLFVSDYLDNKDTMLRVDKYFSNLKDNDGKFKESLVDDTKGLLGLYEATHLRIHGDDILDEALTFTTTHLQSATRRGLSSPLSKQVTHSLNQPFWKRMPRIEARHYISIYQEDKYSHNETLLNFARLDFNLLQQLHQKELCELTRWWKDLDFVKKLPFTRNRLVECYFIALGIFFEPEYYFGRRTFCKVIYMLSAIDDIYDVHGTLEELELFHEAIQRWDISALDQSPDYMKVCFQAQLDVFTEIEEKITSEGNLYAIHHARESLKMTVAGYMKEARWFYSKYTPTFDEYMPLGTLTSSYYLSITAVVGMGLAATKDSLDWLFTDPGILNATSVIGRLLNDIRTHQREHVASAVELYMKEHGATEEEAIEELTNQVNDAWKVIIKACLHPTPVSLPVLMRPLRVASTWEVLYKSADSYTSPGVELKGIVTSLLIEPVPNALA
uniref:(-)-germacrene D synthase-like isoform X1 n=1 Tax=Fragaria vesca subsp. vesca TaxID=101020 RepID=UPI0005C877C1|nr:PREDICTED: (-)-germacrene D synthase-like isoform X1 [Fragaria vesca subsp. vesca]